VSTLAYILLSVTCISLISLIGVIAMALEETTLERVLTALIAFAAGTMLGAAFLDLIPEVMATAALGQVYVLAGIVAFFLIERAIHWHHCIGEKCIAPAGYLNIVGDLAHNFSDGVMVAAAFLTSPQVGLVASVAIAMHELPHELGNFAVLVHSGFTPRRAVWLNFLTACTAILGGLLGYLFLSEAQGLAPYVLALATGGIIYIAVADLMPELHKERRLSRVAAHTASLFLGIFLIGSFIAMAPHQHGAHAHDPAGHHDEVAVKVPGTGGPQAGSLEINHGRGGDRGEIPDNRH
jgi:zinc and cadmium transporter